LTKQDKIGVVLRKLDYEWSKKGKTFCSVIRDFTKSEELTKDITDDEIIDNIKDICPDEKE
jgi:hypothetical protein